MMSGKLPVIRHWESHYVKRSPLCVHAVNNDSCLTGHHIITELSNAAALLHLVESLKLN